MQVAVNEITVPAGQSSDKMSPDFQSFVEELKTAKLRGDEAIRDAVKVIDRYQARYGDSKEMLTKLATAVGVTVRTLYRWKRQVCPATQVPPEEAPDSLTSTNRIADSVMDGSALEIVPLYLRQANELVSTWHRHHEVIKIAQFSIGVEAESPCLKQTGHSSVFSTIVARF